MVGEVTEEGTVTVYYRSRAGQEKKKQITWDLVEETRKYRMIAPFNVDFPL